MIKNMKLSLSLEIKPTDYSCKCKVCNKPILKGEKRIRFAGSAYRDSLMILYHPDCFFRAIKEMLQKGEGILK